MNKKYIITLEFEDDTCDIIHIMAVDIEDAREKILSQNEARLKSPLFKDKTKKIIDLYGYATV